MVGVASGDKVNVLVGKTTPTWVSNLFFDQSVEVESRVESVSFCARVGEETLIIQFFGNLDWFEGHSTVSPSLTVKYELNARLESSLESYVKAETPSFEGLLS